MTRPTVKALFGNVRHVMSGFVNSISVLLSKGAMLNVLHVQESE